MRAPELITLERGRVRLEPFGPQHDAALLEAAQDDDVWRWLPVTRPQATADIARMRDTHPGQPWAVVVDDQPAGCTSYLDVDTGIGGLEIGSTWYRKNLWATEVNPTCKLLLLSYAFDNLGAARVTLKTDALNTRSQAAINKLGCQYDGTLRHNRLRADGTVRDTAYFSMLAAEWPSAKRRLAARADR
ncbi:MAG: putative acetyltransferase [Frankiales bacterium]|nr:putative acetyltransferase [Frankiales bacterium]